MLFFPWTKGSLHQFEWLVSIVLNCYGPGMGNTNMPKHKYRKIPLLYWPIWSIIVFLNTHVLKCIIMMISRWVTYCKYSLVSGKSMTQIFLNQELYCLGWMNEKHYFIVTLSIECMLLHLNVGLCICCRQCLLMCTAGKCMYLMMEPTNCRATELRQTLHSTVILENDQSALLFKCSIY